MRTLMLLLLFGLFVSLCSCNGPKRTLLSESRSPDGKMIAHAYRDEPSGIGTGEIDTFVDLKPTGGAKSGTTILAFDDGLDDPSGDKNVGMNWISKTHLELTYKGPRHIGFQAIKCYGVDISVRDRVSDAGKTAAH